SGGAELLEEWFNYPLSDALSIVDRTATIRYFMEQSMPFPFQSSWFDQALFYLDMADERSRLQGGSLSLRERFQQLVGGDSEYKKIVGGIIACSQIIHCWKDLIRHSPADHSDSYQKELKKWVLKFADSSLEQIPLLQDRQRLSREMVIQYDNILRF